MKSGRPFEQNPKISGNFYPKTADRFSTTPAAGYEKMKQSNTLLNSIVRKFGFFGEKNSVDIASEEHFRALLGRERARVDRNGKEFSVVVLDTESMAEKNGDFSRLVRSLKDRLRSTDDVGWFDKGRLGVFLPDTSIIGAMKVIDDISHARGWVETILEYTIYNYPFRWLIEDRSADSVGGNPSGKGERDEASESLEVEPSQRSECLRPFLANELPFWKRSIDIAAASLGLVLLFPLFVLIGVLIKSVSRGPVLFKQERLGLAEKRFACLKFRTMKVQANTAVHEKHLSLLIKNSDIPMRKLDDEDSRIIPFGRFFRKTGMDELPQLVNVLRGEMSLVGPRPCLPNEADEYLLWHRRRFDIHPGLTGLWQVNGKNRTTFAQMMRFDVTYAKTASFWMDLKILLKTGPAVFEQTIEKKARKESKVWTRA